jgi:hypothetical protein
MPVANQRHCVVVGLPAERDVILGLFVGSPGFLCLNKLPAKKIFREKNFQRKNFSKRGPKVLFLGATK